MSRIFSFDEFELDLDRRELRRRGSATKADGLQLRLLEVFVRSPQRVLSSEELIAQVWEGRAVTENSLAVAITRLRKLLAHEPGVRNMVLTAHRQGYRFVPTVVERDVHPPHAAAPISQLPFVGRERTLGQLRAALAAAVSGNGGAIVLTGEPGIGKTRTADLIAREAVATNHPVVWGCCRELGEAPPLWPFAEIVRAIFDRLPRDISTRDPRLQALVPELARLLPELASPSERAALEREAAEGFSRPVAQHRLFDAVARTLSLAAEREPCLVVFDDLQRADPASLELLHYLLSELPRMRMLLVVTMREVGTQSVDRRLTRVLNHRNCTRVALQPLSEAHVTRYVGLLVGESDPALGHAVFAMSEGNPLFMAELVRQLSASDQPDISRVTTPSVAAELAEQRLAGLDERTRAALSGAAVIGRDFDLPLLQAITVRDAADLMSSLDAAVERAIVMPSRDDPTELSFTHGLLRAALYEALAPALRRSYHLRVAQALEERVMRGEVPGADLAFHARAALPDDVAPNIWALKARLQACAADAQRELARS